ncbi:MAG: tol-pal system protein YbgF [Alphaproteobacteria bacterium]|nr:tol-pal system protein YbgF [Alphaproteobacteria bacterium]
MRTALYLCCLIFVSLVFAPSAEAEDEGQLELRIARFEQILEAQMILLRRERLGDILKLEARLEALEREQQQTPPDLTTDTQNVGTLAGDIVVRLSALEENVRAIRGQFDEINFGITQLSEQLETMRKDNEYRFQALERRAANAPATAPVAIEPQIIGQIKTPAPVDKVELANTPKNKISDIVAGETSRTITLVGEGAPVEVSALPDVKSDVSPDIEAPPSPEEVADVQTLYQQGLRHLRGEAYEEAQRDFQKILARFPDHRLAGNAQYWLGETHYTRGDYTQAAAAFLTGYTDFAASNKAPDSLLKLGMSLAALAKEEAEAGSITEHAAQACNAFGTLATTFPEASASILQRAALEKGRLGCAS